MGDGHDTVEISQAIAAQFGLYSALEGGHLFCGQNDQGFAINGTTYQWPRGSRLTIAVDYSRLGGLSDMDCKDLMVQANREITDCCDVGLTIINSPLQANLRMTIRRLDGPSGVLAQCGIPVGVTSDRGQLSMEFDDSEAWIAAENPPVGKIDWYRVYLHELLHFMGLGHKPANNTAPALIAPMYSPRIRNLQAADIQELQRRYGPAKNVDPVGPAPTPVPVPAGDKLVVEELRVAVGGKRYKLSGSVGPLALVEAE